MELVDLADSKSAVGDYVWVRVPPPAPINKTPIFGRFFFSAFLVFVGEVDVMDTNLTLIQAEMRHLQYVQNERFVYQVHYFTF